MTTFADSLTSLARCSMVTMLWPPCIDYLHTAVISAWRGEQQISKWSTFTLCACARGKVISCHLLWAQESPNLEKLALDEVLSLCHQMIESCKKLSFKLLRTAHEHYKSCIFTSHAYRYLPMPCAVSTAHAWSQSLNNKVYTTHYTTLHCSLLRAQQCYYNGNVATAHGQK